MPRTCSKITKAKLKRIPRVFPDENTRVAYYDALHNKPMSQARENRMLEALGLKRPPRRFYRPCLSVELGEIVKLYDVDVEAVLSWAVKCAIRDEQWRREMDHEV